jgi:hypothetical protein
VEVDISENFVDAFEQFGCPLYVIYGGTEEKAYFQHSLCC